MTTLVIYPAAFGEPSASPFSVKALCLLKYAGVEHSVRETPDPRNTPMSKLPVLEVDGAVIADSDAIRAYVEKKHGVDFDKGLSEAERAASRAVIRMVEEHLYFTVYFERWGKDENWVHVKGKFFSEIPFPLRGFISSRIRKMALTALYGQGVARFSDEDRFARARKDVEAVADLVGEKPFLFGQEPTAADFSVVPMLYASAATPVETPLSGFIKNHERVRPYMERARARLYP